MAKKKKSTKAATKKKVQLKEMNQTDGMGQEEGVRHKATTLNQVWGDDGVSEYRTMDLEVYEKLIHNMSKSDLKHEAIRVGLLPIDNVNQLVIRLVRQFNQHVASYRAPQDQRKEKITLSEESMKILGEGK
jgi:hypothetical protein